MEVYDSVRTIDNKETFIKPLFKNNCFIIYGANAAVNGQKHKPSSVRVTFTIFCRLKYIIIIFEDRARR